MSVNFESNLSSREFLQKTNEWIHFYYYGMCFRSFFGRNWRHQKKPFRNYLTFNNIFLLSYLQWLQKAKTLKLGCPFFSHFMNWSWRPLSLKWYFEAREDIMTNFKSQDLYTLRINYWNASGSGPPLEHRHFTSEIGQDGRTFRSRV